MKFTPEIVAALQTLKDAAENDFERHRIAVLERDLTNPPVVEQIDDKHQKFDGIVYCQPDEKRHYVINLSIQRAIWNYYYGEIPENCMIHHLNRNKSDNNISNFQLVTKSEHKIIHNKDVKLKLQTKICEYCGKVFPVSNFKHRFCSSACAANYYYHNGFVKKVCVICGKEFSTSKKSKTKCCSMSCTSKMLKQNSSLPTIEKECPYCHKKFTTTNKNKLYCSKACCLKAWREKNFPSKIKRICLYCGKEFEISGKGKKKLYCSSSCCSKMQYAKKKSKKTINNLKLEFI